MGPTATMANSQSDCRTASEVEQRTHSGTRLDVLIYQSKANLVTIPHLIDAEIGKILVKGMFGNTDSTSEMCEAAGKITKIL